MKNFENLAGKKVLLVEDDEFLASIIGDRLTATKCFFSHAGSGEEALEFVKKGDLPNIIILDLLLPGTLDGFGFLDKVKANLTFKDIPVVVLSNLNRPQDVERVMKAGAYTYLVKASVVPDEIVEHVSLALSATGPKK